MKDSHNFYVGVSKPWLFVLGCLQQYNFTETSNCIVFIFFQILHLKSGVRLIYGCSLYYDYGIPLYCLHDALTIFSPEDIRTILEESLGLLVGSANCQFSILRRKEILRAINMDKIGLADQSLPNVSRMLFQQL